MAQNTTITARRRGPGRPFEKGRSGNPGGRPKVPEDIKGLLNKNTMSATKKLIALMDSSNERIALQAAIAILDRSLGKPVQAQEVAVEYGGNLDLRAQIHEVLLRREAEKAEAEWEQRKAMEAKEAKLAG